MEKKEKIIRYIQEQIAQADFRARAYVFDELNHKNPTRNCYVKLKMHIQRFLAGNASIRWVVITGFRGVGKTTLLSQLFYETKGDDLYKLYLSVDYVTQMLGVSLGEVLDAYQEIIGVSIERLDKPLLLFLDEVQYDKKWAITLKTIFDRSRRVFIYATGSSALLLQTNPDIERRAFSERLFPMSFTEYAKIKKIKYEKKGLGQSLRKIIFESSSAKEVWQGLKQQEQSVRAYWSGIERLEIDRYLKYGTLPFAIKIQNEAQVYDQIKKILDRVISMDIVEYGQFDSPTLSKVPEILYSVAASDVLVASNLSQDLSINRITLSQILNVLEKTETIKRIYPYASHNSQLNKPSKYLFATPAFRSMYYNFIGSVIGESSYMGKLLEDTVGLYLERILWNKSYSLTYDGVQGGADFIVAIKKQNIIVEAGYGDKGFKQVMATAKRIPSKYGITISMSTLKMDENINIVNVPLSYFLLI